MGHEEMLLQQILNNQEKHETKLDDLAEAVRDVTGKVNESEQRILGKVQKEFVRHEEFPKLWKGEMVCRQKENFEKIDRAAKIMGHIKTWAGWGIASLLFVVAQSDKISALMGR